MLMSALLWPSELATVSGEFSWPFSTTFSDYFGIGWAKMLQDNNKFMGENIAVNEIKEPIEKQWVNKAGHKEEN